jgi:hypothetical protein
VKAAPHRANGASVFMIKAVARRIRRLEDRFGSASGPSGLVVVSCVTLALDSDRCVEILRECGFVGTRGIVIVDLCKVPKGLNKDEIETYLREHGAEVCRCPSTKSCR